MGKQLKEDPNKACEEKMCRRRGGFPLFHDSTFPGAALGGLREVWVLPGVFHILNRVFNNRM